MAKTTLYDGLFLSPDEIKKIADANGILIESLKDLKKEISDMSNSAVKELEKSIKELKKHESIKFGDGKEVQDLLIKVDKLNNEIRRLKKTQDEIGKTEKQIEKQTEKTTESFKDRQRVLENLREINRRSRQDARDNARLNQAEENSIEKLKATMRKLVVQRQRLNLETDEGKNKLKEYTQEINVIENQLREYDEAIQRHQRNVGNYPDLLQSVIVKWFAWTEIIENAIGVLSGIIDAVKEFDKALLRNAKNQITIINAFKLTQNEAKNLNKEIEVLSASTGKSFEDIIPAVNNFQKAFADTGLTADGALRLIENGFKRGADISGGFLDALKEYAPFFRALGFSGAEAMDKIVAGLISGAYDDKVIDALKEFSVTITSGLDDATKKAFNAIGINIEAIQKEIESGAVKPAEVLAGIVKKVDELGINSKESGDIIKAVFKSAGEDAKPFLKTLIETNTEVKELPKNLTDTIESTEKLSRAWVDFKGIFTDTERASGSFFTGFVNVIKKATSGTLDLISGLVSPLEQSVILSQRSIKANIERTRQDILKDNKEINKEILIEQEKLVSEFLRITGKEVANEKDKNELLKKATENVLKERVDAGKKLLDRTAITEEGKLRVSIFKERQFTELYKEEVQKRIGFLEQGQQEEENILNKYKGGATGTDITPRLETIQRIERKEVTSVTSDEGKEQRNKIRRELEKERDFELEILRQLNDAKLISEQQYLSKKEQINIKYSEKIAEDGLVVSEKLKENLEADYNTILEFEIAKYEALKQVRQLYDEEQQAYELAKLEQFRLTKEGQLVEEEEYQKARTEIIENYNKKELSFFEKLSDEKVLASAQASANILNDVRNSTKENTIIYKTAAISQSLIATFVSVIETYKALAGINPILAYASATAAGIFGATQTAKIAGVEGFHDGGYTGDGNEWEVAGQVHRKEYVLTAKQVDGLGGKQGVEELISSELSNRNLVLQNDYYNQYYESKTKEISLKDRYSERNSRTLTSIERNTRQRKQRQIISKKTSAR